MSEMQDRQVPWKQRPLLYWGITAAGTAGFCVYSRSWQDLVHAIYDLTAGVAVFSFVAQVAVEQLTGQGGRLRAVRAWLLLPVALFPAGREFLGWKFSGHLTDSLLVAGVQTAESTLPYWLRALYWAVVAVAVSLRWTVFDAGGHGETYAAIAIAGVSLGIAAVLSRAFRDKPRTTHSGTGRGSTY